MSEGVEAESTAADGKGGGEGAARGWFARLAARDHTRGSLWVSVLALSLPSIAVTLFGFGALQIFELRFLSQLGDNAVAAAGATNQTLRQLFMLLSMGLTVSTQMMIAGAVGAQQTERAEHLAGQSYLLWLALALLGSSTIGLFPGFFVGLVAQDPEVAAQGVVYVRVVFLTLAISSIGQAVSSVLNGAGDAMTPMVISVVTTPFAIAGQWAFAFGAFGMPELGIAGIAIGHGVVGGIIGGGASLLAIFSGRCRVHPRLRHLSPDPEALKQILWMSWQPAMHMLARTMIVIFFMTLAGRFGGKIQAAYTIGLRIEMLAIMVAFPIANACATLVSQNLGAGDLPRAWRSIWTSVGMSFALLWPASFALFFLREDLVGFFTRDPEVLAAASSYLSYSAVILVVYGAYFVAFRTLQAAGDMRSPMWISVGTAAGLGVPLALYLSTQSDFGPTGMWIANLVYALVNTVLMVGVLLRGKWAQAHQ